MADRTERKNRQERRLEERENARFEQAERDSDVLIATSTDSAVATATDGMGVERIVTILPPDYTPAQTDPDPREVQRLANLETKLQGEKQARLEALQGTPDNGGETAKAAIEAEGSVAAPKTGGAEDSTKGKDEQAPAEQPKPEQSKKRS